MVSAGLYIHIPYCKQACSYCDFYFSTNQASRPHTLAAICRELAYRTRHLPSHAPLHSVYLGGGTPSLLSLQELETLFAAIHRHYTVLPDAEITLEANPDDITADLLHGWKSLGINRLSIGIQSLQAPVLRQMHRAHTAAQAHQALALIAGTFTFWTADLIFAVPGRDMAVLMQDLEQLLQYGPPHLSVYGLTVEPGTLLYHQVHRGQILVDEQQYAREFLALHDALAQRGYIHYEISNYALPGAQAVHNSAYWEGKPYIGIGPSAHSYLPPDIRFANVANVHAYARAWEQLLPHENVEQLDTDQRLLEKAMVELRTLKGMDIIVLQSHPDWKTTHASHLARYLAEGYLLFSEGRLMATPRGWLILDSILTDIVP
ncbi:MAG: radical SAM family heme chaperone HemW [Bacteroidetes bacterium]|nr:radical SAM family heme chaperone HemW [Bacteroidota bacterium]